MNRGNDIFDVVWKLALVVLVAVWVNNYVNNIKGEEGTVSAKELVVTEVKVLELHGTGYWEEDGYTYKRVSGSGDEVGYEVKVEKTGNEYKIYVGKESGKLTRIEKKTQEDK